jgi:hypothetical protein
MPQYLVAIYHPWIGANGKPSCTLQKGETA